MAKNVLKYLLLPKNIMHIISIYGNTRANVFMSKNVDNLST